MLDPLLLSETIRQKLVTFYQRRRQKKHLRYVIEDKEENNN